MLFRSEQFDKRLDNPAGWSDHVFRYCDFSDITADGGEIDSVFIGCTFENCEWYWSLFNGAVFVGVHFTGCSFLGSSFAGCKFVECQFQVCTFTKDNLGGDCSFDDVAWYGCTQMGSSGLEHAFQPAR